MAWKSGPLGHDSEWFILAFLSLATLTAAIFSSTLFHDALLHQYRIFMRLLSLIRSIYLQVRRLGSQEDSIVGPMMVISSASPLSTLRPSMYFLGERISDFPKDM